MNDTLPAVGNLSPEWLDFFLMLGAIVLVLIGVFFWALFSRKDGKSRRKHRRKHHEHPATFRERFKKGAGDIRQLLNKHQRRNRRGHRPANPTLAQTGGLPPVREEKKTDGTTPPP